MEIEQARYATPANDAIVAVIDGVMVSIPCDPKNIHYQQVMASGDILPFDPQITPVGN